MQHSGNSSLGVGQQQQQYAQYDYNQMYEYNPSYNETTRAVTVPSSNEHNMGERDRDYRRDKEPERDRYERRREARGSGKDDEDASDYNYYYDNNSGGYQSSSYGENVNYSHRGGQTSHSGDEYSYDGSNDSSYHDRRRRTRDRDRRERGRDRERSRDRDKWGGSSRDRSRDKGRDRSRDRERRKNREREKEKGKEREWERDCPKRETSWKEETPHHTIMLRGLPLHVTENDIRCEVFSCGLEVKDVRLLRKRETGTSRGFAFVEFKAVSDAIRWMEMKQGTILLQDRYHVSMHYSIPKDGIARDTGGNSVNIKVRYDWDCIKCGAHNFRRRDFCYMCSASREGADQAQFSDGYEEYSSTPRSTLLFRNLDVLTTEDKVLAALQEVTTFPIKNIRVAKDTLTGTSRGFCYVELNSTGEAVILHDRLQSLEPPLEVDGKIVYISYAKQSLCSLVSATSATVASTAMAAAQWTNQIPVGAYQQSYNGTAAIASEIVATSVTTSFGNVTNPASASKIIDGVTTVAAQPTAALAYQQQYYAPTSAVGYVQLSTTTNPTAVTQVVTVPAVAVQVAAVTTLDHASNATGSYQLGNSPTIINAPQAGNSVAIASIDTTNIGVADANGEYPKYPIPDASTYQYDTTTGYYYDSGSGLYYDANSQYYYNSMTQKFLYWDNDRQTYIVATTAISDIDGDSQPNSQTGDGTMKKTKERDKQDKVKIAKKIAKDMERWAKTLNQKKENAKQGIVAIQSVAPDSLSKQPPTADAGFAVLEKKSTLAERQAAVMEAMKKKESEERKSSLGKKSGLVAAYGEGSESDDDVETGNILAENRLTDWQKLACLLCKRQFTSKEALLRHQQLSDLHKQNYEKMKVSVNLQDSESRYRDRAKERRERYGEPEVPTLKMPHKATNVSTMIDYEEPTKHGLDSSNLGNQMLKAMGWQEGQGLGRSNQGRLDIVEAHKRTASSGLGMKGSTYGATAGDTYKDTIKKMMQVRYNEDEG